MYTPEVQSRLAALRAKSAANTLTLDEMKEAVALMRGSRLSAAEQAKKSKSKKAPAKSADDLLSELGSLNAP